MLAMEFLGAGATLYGEPGVFMTFEETGAELVTEHALAGLRSGEVGRRGRSSSPIMSASNAARLRKRANTTWKGFSSAWIYAIKTIGAKRVVLDTVEALFAGLPNESILRAELRRLFTWLKRSRDNRHHHRRARRRAR